MNGFALLRQGMVLTPYEMVPGVLKRDPNYVTR
jgi:hypothetical protein